jgi:hypothetical protein
MNWHNAALFIGGMFIGACIVIGIGILQHPRKDIEDESKGCVSDSE